MVAVKGNEADALLARLPTAPFFLVYGPDAGLVSERGTRLASAFSSPDDPFSLLRLDAAAIASDPNRLADEAYAVSLFGGRRAILIRDGGSRPAVATALKVIFGAPPTDTTIVVEAGDLQKSNPLRTLFERAKDAYAIPCYADEGAALLRLVDEEMRSAGLGLTPDARHLLVGLLGGDRLQSRGELEKLRFYAADAGTVTVDHVYAVISNAASIGMDDVVDAAATGDVPALADRLRRAYADGITPDALVGATLRHFQMLDRTRAVVEAGATPVEAVDGMRPPVFFKRRDKVLKALQVWSGARLVKALRVLSEAARDVRLADSLKAEVLGEALFTLARAASRG
jgi:DNA polymerase III subunit delta